MKKISLITLLLALFTYFTITPPPLTKRTPSAANQQEKCLKLLKSILNNSVSSNPKALELYKTLQELSPDLSLDMIAQKVAATDSEFLFYRSFVSYFYKILKDSETSFPLSPEIKSFKGHDPGDLHIDNFGLIHINPKKSIYSMNDPDSGAVIPLYAGLLRYLSGLNLFDKNFHQANFDNLLPNYYRGLKGGKMEMPQILKKMKKKISKSKLSIPKKEVVKVNGKLKLKKEIRRMRIPTELSLDEITDFEVILKESFGRKTKILDSFKFLNITGGSGGLMRYRLLVKLDKSFRYEGLNKEILLEFKQIPPQRTNPMQVPSLYTSVTQNLQLITNSSKDFQSPFYREISGLFLPLFQRPRFSAFKAQKSATELSQDDRLEVIQYQLYLIGQIHRQSLGKNLESYIKAHSSINISDWQAMAQNLAQQLSTSFRESR
jgi:hypothetical protein